MFKSRTADWIFWWFFSVSPHEFLDSTLRIRRLTLPFRFFLIHHSRVTLTFDALEPSLLKKRREINYRKFGNNVLKPTFNAALAYRVLQR
jgi:hypothetical protein